MDNKVPQLQLPFEGEYPVTQGFGVPEKYKDKIIKHSGIDYGMPCGTTVRAAAAGRVSKVVTNTPSDGYGNYLEIDHGGITTLYGHLNKVAVFVNKLVAKNEIIGVSGNTGFTIGTSGCHLHFTVLQLGLPVNPLTFFKPHMKEPITVAEPSDKLIPLFRLYNPGTKDHFYTTSPNEVQAAVETDGYTYEGVLGHIRANS